MQNTGHDRSLTCSGFLCPQHHAKYNSIRMPMSSLRCILGSITGVLLLHSDTVDLAVRVR